MIKINLTPGKKASSVFVSGLDLSKVNLKLLAIAIVITFLPEIIVYPTWDEETNQKQSELTTLSAQISKLQAKVNANKAIQEQIEALNVQEKKLAEKLEVVKKLIKTKKNPMNIMLYISKNIPDDLWIAEMSIKDESLKLVGESYSYKSIGKFVQDLKNSVFFDPTFDLIQAKTNETANGKRRVEAFEIGGKIARFE